jgi:serine/threonine-protein kinase RsbW
MRKPLD